MIVFLDAPKSDWEKRAAELPEGVIGGQLLTPLTCQSYVGGGVPWAADNGAFSNFSGTRFVSFLKRKMEHRGSCRFVACPDVVGSARRTLECFEVWYPRLNGWPLALVCQDGQEDLPIPWSLISGVFIGGSTSWKLSGCAEGVIRAAQVIGRWVHVGRVNTPERFDKFLELGVDSIDGSGISRYSHMRRALGNGNELFSGGTAP